MQLEMPISKELQVVVRQERRKKKKPRVPCSKEGEKEHR